MNIKLKIAVMLVMVMILTPIVSISITEHIQKLSPTLAVTNIRNL